jgi:hypothetical protein
MSILSFPAGIGYAALFGFRAESLIFGFLEVTGADFTAFA